MVTSGSSDVPSLADLFRLTRDHATPREARAAAVLRLAAACEARDQPLMAARAYLASASEHWHSRDDARRRIESAIGLLTTAVERLAGTPLRCAVAHVLMNECFQVLLPHVKDKPAVRRQQAQTQRELAHHLSTLGVSSGEFRGYLVRGVVVETDYASHFQVQFPEHEIDSDTWLSTATSDQLQVPSVFMLKLILLDYQGAQEVADACPEGFTTPGLRGWRCSIAALTGRANAAVAFREAAEEFESDVPTETVPRWSSKNSTLWGPYFRSRAALARTLEVGQRGPTELLGDLAEGALLWSVWRDEGVSRYRLLLRVISALLGSSTGTKPELAIAELALCRQLFGDFHGDDRLERALSLAASHLTRLETEPLSVFTSSDLSELLQLLDGHPLFQPRLGSALKADLSVATQRALPDPSSDLTRKKLQAVAREVDLQLVLLRLCQALHPTYAQIRHGAFEFGKDLIAERVVEGRYQLLVFQVKCGNISTPVWREAKSELEEMVQIPTPRLQLSAPRHAVLNVLVCNGHALPSVEPRIEGWIESQRQLGHTFEFWHLDKLVSWVQQEHLEADLRLALQEVSEGRR